MAEVFKDVSNDVDGTFYGKFKKNEQQIRGLATADPNSYAALVVKSVDHFITGAAMITKQSNESGERCCATRILKEFADSLRASEIFSLWTDEIRCNVQTMAENAIKSEGFRTSDLDRYARICFGMMKILNGEVDARNFMDECRKKYQTEIFFHRIYCSMFSSTREWEAGLKASDEACKLFPNDANILNARAVMLRMMIDKGVVDYQHWSRVKKQVGDVKQAFKDFLKIAPKDHRHFAENNYFIAYFALKYATPSAKMMHCDMQEINVYFQNGLNSELDILHCFRPFTSQAKDFVAEYKKFDPTTVNVYNEGNTCTIDMTSRGMPKLERIPTNNMTIIDMREPSKRRIDVCVPHRRLLQKMLLDPIIAVIMTQINTDQSMNCVTRSSSEMDSNNFEEIILYQMTMVNESRKFTSKVIQLTAVEDPVYISGSFETIVADTTGDVIKLHLDVGAECKENFVLLKELFRTFRFGTVWKLQNPELHMENADESTMCIRATTDCMIPMDEGHQNGYKCRTCFTQLHPGLKCAKCRSAIYCGKHCQTQDWKYIKHNLICSDAYTNFHNQLTADNLL